MTQDLLDIYADFLIAQSQYATVTSLSNLLEGSISTIHLYDFSTKMHLVVRTLVETFQMTESSTKDTRKQFDQLLPM